MALLRFAYYNLSSTEKQNVFILPFRLPAVMLGYKKISSSFLRLAFQKVIFQVFESVHFYFPRKRKARE